MNSKKGCSTCATGWQSFINYGRI